MCGGEKIIGKDISSSVCGEFSTDIILENPNAILEQLTPDGKIIPILAPILLTKKIKLNMNNVNFEIIDAERIVDLYVNQNTVIKAPPPATKSMLLMDKK